MIATVSPTRGLLVQAVRDMRVTLDHLQHGEISLALLSWGWSQRRLGGFVERASSSEDLRRLRRVENVSEVVLFRVMGFLRGRS